MIAPITDGAIRTNHRLLCAELRPCLGFDVEIAGAGDWYRAATGSIVAFKMVPKQGGPHLLHEGDQLIQGLPVRPCRPERAISLDLNFWVDWYEKWHKVGGRNFTLSEAGWRLYAGVDTTGSEVELILRAEWGPFNEDGRIKSVAGQPHWHAHVGFRTSVQAARVDQPAVSSPSPEVPDEGLVEEDVPKGVGLTEERATISGISLRHNTRVFDVTDVHLGMAGWKNGGDGIQSWHSDMPDGAAKALREWAPQALAYLQTQLVHVACT